MLAAVNVPAWANNYVGLPYLTYGRGRDGVDCWGIVVMIWREIYGYALPEVDGLFWRGWAEVDLLKGRVAEQRSMFAEISAAEAREGDGVLFKIRNAPAHVGLVLRPGVMLHAMRGADSCIERYDSWKWNKRIAGFYRHEHAGR